MTQKQTETTVLDEPRTSSQTLGTSEQAVSDFFDSITSEAPVSGATHLHYRYPARFSPEFARSAIRAFTVPGETVLDPFLGGGTSAVESQLEGRRFVGIDINPLAVFISRMKTTPLSTKDIRCLLDWSQDLPLLVNLHHPYPRHEEWIDYQRNIPWWLRKTLEIALDSIDNLPHRRVQEFARATLLKTAQWALDCRTSLPSSSEFIETHQTNVGEMVRAAFEFGRDAANAFGSQPSRVSSQRRIICRSADGLSNDGRIPNAWMPPRLVLTSPPYIGIHVLYHRWQVQGRRETPAPYWLAQCRDGHGASYYTFADRRRKDAEDYLSSVKSAFSSIVPLLSRDSLVVQMVAFADAREQLSMYLDALASVGLEEVDASLDRLWRSVPNRKWYIRSKTCHEERREIVLVHRCKS